MHDNSVLQHVGTVELSRHSHRLPDRKTTLYPLSAYNRVGHEPTTEYLDGLVNKSCVAMMKPRGSASVSTLSRWVTVISK